MAIIYSESGSDCNTLDMEPFPNKIPERRFQFITRVTQIPVPEYSLNMKSKERFLESVTISVENTSPQFERIFF